MTKDTPRFVQISARAGDAHSSPTLFALDEFGNVWEYNTCYGYWTCLGMRVSDAN